MPTATDETILTPLRLHPAQDEWLRARADLNERNVTGEVRWLVAAAMRGELEPVESPKPKADEPALELSTVKLRADQHEWINGQPASIADSLRAVIAGAMAAEA